MICLHKAVRTLGSQFKEAMTLTSMAGLLRVGQALVRQVGEAVPPSYMTTGLLKVWNPMEAVPPFAAMKGQILEKQARETVLSIPRLVCPPLQQLSSPESEAQGIFIPSSTTSLPRFFQAK